MSSGQDKENGGEPSFEEALAELQRIAGELESGSLGLEDSLARFEQGIALLRKCNAILERAEQKIEILTGRDASGELTSAPFDATATVASPRPAEERPKPKSDRVPPPKGRTSETTVVVTERIVVESDLSDADSDAEEDDGPRLF